MGVPWTIYLCLSWAFAIYLEWRDTRKFDRDSWPQEAIDDPKLYHTITLVCVVVAPIMLPICILYTMVFGKPGGTMVPPRD